MDNMLLEKACKTVRRRINSANGEGRFSKYVTWCGYLGVMYTNGGIIYIYVSDGTSKKRVEAQANASGSIYTEEVSDIEAMRIVLRQLDRCSSNASVDVGKVWPIHIIYAGESLESLAIENDLEADALDGER